MSKINHLAVVASVIVNQVLGFLWYAVFFADAWVQGLGKQMSDFNQSDPVPFILDVAGWAVAAYVLAGLALRLNVNTAAKGALLGAVLWLGVSFASIVPHYAFAGLSGSVMLIDASNTLVRLLAAGAIIGVWRKKEALVAA